MTDLNKTFSESLFKNLCKAFVNLENLMTVMWAALLRVKKQTYVRTCIDFDGDI